MWIRDSEWIAQSHDLILELDHYGGINSIPPSSGMDWSSYSSSSESSSSKELGGRSGSSMSAEESRLTDMAIWFSSIWSSSAICWRISNRLGCCAAAAWLSSSSRSFAMLAASRWLSLLDLADREDLMLLLNFDSSSSDYWLFLCSAGYLSASAGMVCSSAGWFSCPPYYCAS